MDEVCYTISMVKENGGRNKIVINQQDEDCDSFMHQTHISVVKHDT